MSSTLPPKCVTSSDCSPQDMCVGGNGMQSCSTCESIECNGANGVFYCSCNGDSTNGVQYCMNVEECIGKICIGGNGPQSCDTCETKQCFNNQCACNGDAGTGGNVPVR